MINVRLATDNDTAFLQQVYASTRLEEMALVDWGVEQRAQFLHMQFQAQRQHYDQFYPGTTYHVIQQDDAGIGRLILYVTTEEILLMDIALLPPFRNGGIGTRLVQALQDKARPVGKNIRLYVEGFNPAFRLYQRLGFTTIGEAGLYLEMIWQPRADQPVAAPGETMERQTP